MNKNKVSGLIQQIESSLSALKVEFSISEEKTKPASKKTERRKTVRNNKGRGSTKPIEALIASGFFKSPKTDLEVVDTLKKRALKFDRKDIAVTLMRFVRKETLEREGDGTKGSPWRYKKV